MSFITCLKKETTEKEFCPPLRSVDQNIYRDIDALSSAGIPIYY